MTKWSRLREGTSTRRDLATFSPRGVLGGFAMGSEPRLTGQLSFLAKPGAGHQAKLSCVMILFTRSMSVGRMMGLHGHDGHVEGFACSIWLSRV